MGSYVESCPSCLFGIMDKNKLIECLKTTSEWLKENQNWDSYDVSRYILSCLGEDVSNMEKPEDADKDHTVANLHINGLIDELEKMSDVEIMIEDSLNSGCEHENYVKKETCTSFEKEKANRGMACGCCLNEFECANNGYHVGLDFEFGG